MMAIEQPRHFCALGAQQTVLAIERAIPILHAGPGCSAKIFSGMGFASGYQGSGYAGGSAVPCTNTGEKEVVFGGDDRLRQVIEGALKVMDGDLFVVLTGCTAEIVGDDVAQVVGEFQSRGLPVVHAETGGFKGTSFQGHELVARAIIGQLLKPAPSPVRGLVNVWSVVPYQDPFWSGNLEALRSLLTGIGLTPNMLFGFGSGGLEAWRKIPAAQFNLLISPWVGLEIVQELQGLFETPFLHYPVFPIGARETSSFLYAVGQFAGLAEEQVRAYTEAQEAAFYHYLERAADFLLEFRYDLPGRFFNVGDSLYALGISRFLVNDLGLLPGQQFITDDPPAGRRERIAGEFASLGPNVSAGVTFTPDGGEVMRELRAYHHLHQPLIIGSSWDRDIAAELDGYHLSIGLPVRDRLILDRFYAGYRGGLRLAEDIYAAILGSYQ